MKNKRLLKTLGVLVCAALLAVGSVLGTVAYLTSTATVKNTFTLGSISIELKESTGSNYKMIPGTEIKKDPTVILKENSEPCYIFVHIHAAGVDGVLSFEMADGWEELPGQEHVFYREQTTLAQSDILFPILKNDRVLVSSSVNVNTGNATLAFSAYAIQSAGIAANGEKTAVQVAWDTVYTAADDQFA